MQPPLLHTELPAYPTQGERCLLPMSVPFSTATKFESNELQESVRARVRIGIITLNYLHADDLPRSKVPNRHQRQAYQHMAELARYFVRFPDGVIPASVKRHLSLWLARGGGVPLEVWISFEG